MTYKERIYGKWILAGEHAVLRGHPALVFPVPSGYMDIELDMSSENFSVNCESVQGEQLQMVFLSLMQQAVTELGRNAEDLKGTVSLENTLSLVGGMGASAVLCVAVSKVLNVMGWLEENRLYEFSKTLEHYFHGESSGVDIAAALVGKPLKFSTPNQWEPLIADWEPYYLYLSHCGERGGTSECVESVKAWSQQYPEQALAVDEKMAETVEQLLLSFKQKNKNQFLAAITNSRQCFYDWGLVTPSLKDHMDLLESKGALTCKPTGSGGGGFVLSVWEHKAPEDISIDLLPVSLSL